jgi:hypothetical protein
MVRTTVSFWDGFPDDRLLADVPLWPADLTLNAIEIERTKSPYTITWISWKDNHALNFAAC